MTTRRKLLLVLVAGAYIPSIAAFAQQKRVRRIGFFTGGGSHANVDRLTAFREGMLELRWVEERDYVIDPRYANGIAQDMPSLAAELIASRPDLLLTSGDEGARQCAQRTKTIPIVFTIAQSPVESGIVASLQRPGGNVTGLTNLGRDLSAKRLQLLKEAFPHVAHVALFVQPDNVGNVSEAKEIEEAAPSLGMRITRIELRRPADTEPAFKRSTALGAQSYIVNQGGVISSQRRMIADRILRLKAPAIAGFSEYVEVGGLMSYSASARDNFRRAASYVDKILKGAKPGDLPVEQPTKFELVVNLKTAKAMGITFPQSFLARADLVID